MPRARRHRLSVEYQISRHQLETLIYDAVAKRNIILDNEICLIIEHILDNMPKPLDRIYLPHWCRTFIQPYLAEIEPHIPLAKNICEDIRKELLLALYKPELTKFAMLALNAKTRVNPHWIDLNCPSVARIIRKQFRSPEGKIDWQFIADRMGISRIFSFMTQDRRNLQTAIHELDALLTSKQPKTFNGRWIKKENLHLYEHLRTQYRTHEDLPDWPRIIALMDPHWQERWKFRKLSRGKTLQQAIELLLTALRTINPDQFGPAWIEDHVPFTFRFFRYNIMRREGHVNWRVLYDLLPDTWKERWHNRNYSFKQVIITLNTLLKTHKPLEFNTRWIRRHNCGLLGQIWHHVRTPDNKAIDWDAIIKELDPIWQTKWHPRRHDYMAGVKEYENSTEVDAIVSNYRENLYVFFSCESKQERDMRNIISHELLQIAQKGNINAEDALIMYATFTMNDWIDRNPRLASFRIFPDKSAHRLKKCIHGYQEWEDGAPFFGYLYASLIAEAKMMHVNSLDQVINPYDTRDQRTLYDKIAFDDDHCT